MNREKILLILVSLALAVTLWLGVTRYPHHAWCLCDTCHEQFDNERR